MKSISIIILAVATIIVVSLILYNKGYFDSVTESFSGSFDPSARLSVGGIGPINKDPPYNEGYCGACK